MMKKLLVLMLVLGLASVANAVILGSYTLQVAPASGGPYSAVVDSQLTLMPSDNLWIGVHNSIAGVPGAMQKDTFLLGIVQPAAGGPANTTWTGQWVVFKPPLVADAPVPENEYYGIDTAYDDQENPIKADWWQLNLTSASMTLQGIGILDAKQLHCDFGPSDDVIMLMNATSGVIEDTIIIHQIVPEPTTIALLGFGGLLLRRRKK